MEEIELVRLERIANNMIVDHKMLERMEGDYGTIYLAHGLNADRTIVGVWGYRGIARTMEFNDGTSLQNVRAALANDAAGLIQQMAERGLIDGGNSKPT